MFDDDDDIEDELELRWTPTGFVARVPPPRREDRSVEIATGISVVVATVMLLPTGVLGLTVAWMVGFVILAVAWSLRRRFGPKPVDVAVVGHELQLSGGLDARHALHRLRDVELVGDVLWVRTHEGPDVPLAAERLSEDARRILGQILGEAIATRRADPRSDAWEASQALRGVRSAD